MQTHVKPRLTQRAIAALLSVAQEFDAGHDAEMTEAVGVAKEGDGEAFMAALAQGIAALAARQHG